MEVAQLWEHVPHGWHAHIDITDCPDAGTLIRVAANRREALEASSHSDVARLVRTELAKQGHSYGRGGYRSARLAEVEEQEEVEAMTASAPAPKNLQLPGNYTYPVSDFRSKKVPPRPCRHCGNPLHYDNDCGSWRQAGRQKSSFASNSKSGTAYQSSYVSMLEDDFEEYAAHVAAFAAEAYGDSYPTTPVFTADSGINTRAAYVGVAVEATWADLAIDSETLETTRDLPAEGCYEPAPSWDKPPGHAVQGVDAFKVLCHVNDL